MAFDQTNQKQERNLYRFNFDEENKIMYISYFESPYKEWDSNMLESITKYL